MHVTGFERRLARPVVSYKRPSGGQPVPTFCCVVTSVEKAGGWANDANTILSSYAAAASASEPATIAS
jgi:hypothetical protein